MAHERRVLRLQKLIQEVAAEALLREISDPRLDLVSITRVKLTADLTKATLGWSCLAKEKNRAKIEEVLQGALPIIQRRIGQEIRIRITPRIELKYDPALERAQRLDDIFHHLAEERVDPDEEDLEQGVEAIEAADVSLDHPADQVPDHTPDHVPDAQPDTDSDAKR